MEEEAASTEAYSDMTFADVDSHHELGFSAHEDKNVTCQSKQSFLAGLECEANNGGVCLAHSGPTLGFNCASFVLVVSTSRFLMITDEF